MGKGYSFSDDFTLQTLKPLSNILENFPFISPNEKLLTYRYTFLYTTQNLLRITFSFNDLMLKTNRLKKDFFYKDRLIFGLDDPIANMLIRHVYYA